MIADSIRSQIAGALKARDEIRLSTLRLLSSALNYEKIAKQHELSSEEETAVVKKEAKKRTDAIEIYEKVNAIDRAEKEKKELAILQEYMPEAMSDSDINKVVEKTLSSLGEIKPQDIGRVIGEVMKKLAGRADGKKVSEMIKAKLS